MAEPQAAAASLPTRGRITLRGLPSGVITVGDTGVKGSCILIGDQFSSWIPHVGFLGLKVTGVLLKSSKLFDLIESKFGNECNVQVGDRELAQMRADPGSPTMMRYVSLSKPVPDSS
jgi:hypothetical protein